MDCLRLKTILSLNTPSGEKEPAPHPGPWGKPTEQMLTKASIHVEEEQETLSLLLGTLLPIFPSSWNSLRYYHFLPFPERELEAQQGQTTSLKSHVTSQEAAPKWRRACFLRRKSRKQKHHHTLRWMSAATSISNLPSAMFCHEAAQGQQVRTNSRKRKHPVHFI